MTPDALWEGFCAPPDEARPRAWWHWMDGNVDPAGIRLDLEWLHRAGVRGVQMFDGGMGTPLVVPRAGAARVAGVAGGRSAWPRDLAAARPRVRRRHLCGLERGRRPVGGAGRRHEEGRLVRDGGRGRRAGRAAARPLPDVAGPYQDCPRWGADRRGHRFAQDWVAIAVPADPFRPAAPARCGVGPRRRRLGAAGRRLLRPLGVAAADPDGPSTAWIEQVFDDPVTVAAVTVGLPGPRGFGAAPAADGRAGGQRRRSQLPRVADLAAPATPAGPCRYAPSPSRR